jgi:hypothetical protein
MWIYVFLPLVFHYFTLTFLEGNFSLRNVILLSLNSFLLFAFLPPILFVLLFSLFLLWLVKFFSVVLHERGSLRAYLLHSAVFGLLFLLLSSPFLLVVGSGQEAINPTSTLGDYFYNYSKTNLLNLLRLAGNEGNGQWQLQYNLPTIVNLTGYAAVLIVAFLLVRMKKPQSLTFYSYFLAFLVIAGFTHILSSDKDFGSLFFTKFWLASTIRNPTKIYDVLLPLFVFFVGYAIDRYYEGRTLAFKKAANLALVFLILLYGWPLVRGDLGLFVRPSSIAINEDIKQIAELAKDEKGRSLIIPANHIHELTYQNVSRSLNTIRFGGSLPRTTEFLENAIGTFNSINKTFFKYLEYAGVTNVFLLKNDFEFDETSFTLFANHLTTEEADRFLTEGGLKMVKDYGNYIHYVSEKPHGLVYSPSQLNNIEGNFDLSQMGIAFGITSVFSENLDKDKFLIANSYALVDEPDRNKSVNRGLVYNPSLVLIEFYKEGGRFIMNNLNPDYSLRENLLDVAVEPNVNVLQIGTQSYVLSDSRQNLIVRSGLQDLRLASSTAIDLSGIDPSFEDPNAVKAGDASVARFGEPAISGSLVPDATNLNSSFLLESENHIAYVAKDLPGINPDREYLLAFDYKNVMGKSGAFALWQSGVNISEDRGDLGNTKDWKKQHVFFSMDPEAEDISLYLYTDSEGMGKSQNQYDNIELFELNETSAHTINTRSYEPIIDVQNFDRSVAVSGNLLANASFEDRGLWGGVGDASPGAPGEPDLRAIQTTDSIDGKYALSLRSGNHTAYAYQTASSFEPNAIYKFSFSYKHVSGSRPAVAVWQTGANKSVISRSLNTTGGWDYYEEYFVPDAGATDLSLFFYSSSSGQDSENIYDNVHLQKIPLISKFLVDSPITVSSKLSNIVEGYERINPAAVKVSLAQSENPGLVVFNESFNKGWRAYLASEGESNTLLDTLLLRTKGTRLSEDNHIIVNGFANGWWVEPGASDGDKRILYLEYWPQRYYFLGLAVSFVTLACALAYLLVTKLRNRREIHEQD